MTGKLVRDSLHRLYFVHIQRVYMLECNVMCTNRRQPPTLRAYVNLEYMLMRQYNSKFVLETENVDL
jgi:hypothetical protein